MSAAADAMAQNTTWELIQRADCVAQRSRAGPSLVTARFARKASDAVRPAGGRAQLWPASADRVFHAVHPTKRRV